MQLDVGYGDAVTPGPEEVVYPTLLDDQPPPCLRVYPRASVVAEKLEAIVSLGMANSRMKDYFDLRALAHEGVLDAPSYWVMRSRQRFSAVEQQCRWRCRSV